MNYTKKMETSEMCLELGKIRGELLDITSSIEKIAKNIAVLDGLKGKSADVCVFDFNRPIAEETVLNKMLEEEMIALPQDYVKVVRCKDCCHRVHDEERHLYYCGKYYGQGDVSDENFCQWGERKEP